MALVVYSYKGDPTTYMVNDLTLEQARKVKALFTSEKYKQYGFQFVKVVRERTEA